MKRVLVTGATGFIGRHTLPHLIARGFEVHAVERRASAPILGVHWHTADLLQPKEIAPLIDHVKPSHLLHLAWYAEHGKFWASQFNLDWFDASLELFRSFVKRGGRRATVSGSCAEYDWSGGELIEDQTPTKPATFYGSTKDELRQLLEFSSKESSVSLAWGRVFFLYGPNEQSGRFVASVVSSVRASQPVIVKSGHHVRDFMHVEDVAAALAHVLDSEFEGAINIASGEAVTLGDVARLAADIAGKSDLLQIGEAPDTLENPRVLTANVTRLRNLGFKPRITLREGLTRLIQS
jgi:nucleoside-diphosphate-sugar epimerase